MQGLTDYPRQDLAVDVVRWLLAGQDIQRGFGADLVDTDGSLLEDISADVHDPWTVTHDNTQQIHGSLSINLTRELAWGVDRVRPWMTLSGWMPSATGTGGPTWVTARFNAGVYLLSTPTRTYGRDPIVYACRGQDLLTLADRQVADTYVVTKSTTVLSALRTVLTKVGITAVPLLDGTLQDTVTPYDMVWALSNETWLDIADDLMALIAYDDVWMDENGVPRSEPIAPVEQRPVEWPFDTADKATDLVKADYAETMDLWHAYNHWRFVANNFQVNGAPAMPTEDNGGVYDFKNQSDGLSSVDSIGLNSAPVQVLDVADGDSLIAEGNRIIAADQRVQQTFTISVDPLPIAGHRDVVTLVNDRGTFKMQVSSWSLTPGGKGQWVLGGGTGGSPDPKAPETQAPTSSATGTITQASPLRAVVDGATTDSFVNALDAATYSFGQRVTVTIRNPLPPLIQGSES